MSKKPKKPKKQPPEMSQIMEEWDKWAKDKIPEGEKGTGKQGLEFYGYLKTEKQQLLEFKFAGDGRMLRRTCCRDLSWRPLSLGLPTVRPPER
jgi:hypothetical protein